ncbi:ABC transporter permease [Jiella sonneratiae]|uniref:Iron chelate uptake ABC transporter family permease subunit n=1 Tax=Jiella sonneratiae TaxID=2816856 RepID=A0ABS3J3L5_9HYPH|nr:iron chelate uptake ABC transporter family permease subunit [Jiella sonneratiae]MBO0903730.1 iron chelate uptake ABC transporter family permease subunit [Jiella sonneratiae]
MSDRRLLSLGLLGLAVLFVAGLFVGAGKLSLAQVAGGGIDAETLRLLFVSRIPRTAAALLAGASLAVAGLLMQMLSSNRFVEPSTVGTSEAAGLGMVVVTMLFPGAPVFAKMLVASGFALAGTCVFVALIRRLRLKSGLLVPLVGLILAGIIQAMAHFLAYRADLLQSLGAWSSGDFSMVLRGRYELLWIGLVLCALALLAADRFTLAGLGRDVSVNLGLAYEKVVALGLVIVSLIAAVTVATIGTIPFVGLVVPNLVTTAMGDNGRRVIPFVAIAGAGLVLGCDLLGRSLRSPYEIPVGVIMGVAGAAIFLALIARGRPAHG